MTEVTVTPLTAVSSGVGLALFLASALQWLRKNVVEVLISTGVAFTIGYTLNVYMMLFTYQGTGKVPAGSLVVGQGNVANAVLCMSLLTTVGFALFGYWRAVGNTRFWGDMVRFPRHVTDTFQADGKAVWIHLLWGAALGLLLGQFVSQLASIAIGAVLATGADARAR